MSSAVITHCGHFFHGSCLRKWLYVQETCPLCHQTVRQNSPAYGPVSGPPTAGPAHEDTGLNHVEDEGDQNQHSDMFSHTQIESGAAQDTVKQLEGDDLCCGENGGKPEEPVEPNKGFHGLCFSSTGDFVGFSGPVPVYTSGDFIHSGVLQQNTSLLDPCTQGQDWTALRRSSPSAVNENKFEVQSDDLHAKTEVAMCPDDGAHEQMNGLSSTYTSDHENDNHSDIQTPAQSTELLIPVNDSSNCIENDAYSCLPLEPPLCPQECLEGV